MEGQEWVEALFMARFGMLLAAVVTGSSGGVLCVQLRVIDD